jgi:hypothetical protein
MVEGVVEMMKHYMQLVGNCTPELAPPGLVDPVERATPRPTTSGITFHL